MDYRKSNAPTNTVTRDMMKLSEETGNVYETVAIISKRANKISVEMKRNKIWKRNFKSSLLTMTTWRKSLKTVSRSRFHATMRNFRNQR